MVKIIVFLLFIFITIIALLIALGSLLYLAIQVIRHISYGKTLHFLRNVSIVFVIGAVLTFGFAYSSQWMTSTPAIEDSQGNEIENSVAQLKSIELNGRTEWISIRGEDHTKPILLFLAGGPGGTQMAAVRHSLKELEKDFVVVNWDQPGSGKSYRAIDREDLTVDTYIEDGIALTEYLQETFQQEKIYLMGESWGSALGIFMADKKPEYYHAFIGTGQMIAFVETERLDYQKAMEIAEEKKDQGKIDELKNIGEPPYYGSEVTTNSMVYLNYLSSYMQQNPNIQNSSYQTMRDIGSQEYGIFDKIYFLIGLMNTFNHVYPQLYDIDLRKDYANIEVPLYFLLGRHDINAPLSLVEDYYDIVQAPHKEIVYFEHSGHSPWLNETDKFVQEVRRIKESK